MAVLVFGSPACALEGDYDARIQGRQVLTPPFPVAPRITGATIFGVRPGKPIRCRISATGEKPIRFFAAGLPEGVEVDPATGWIHPRSAHYARRAKANSYQYKLRNTVNLSENQLLAQRSFSFDFGDSTLVLNRHVLNRHVLNRHVLNRHVLNRHVLNLGVDCGFANHSSL